MLSKKIHHQKISSPLERGRDHSMFHPASTANWRKEPIFRGSATLIKGRYKLIYIFGFSGDPESDKSIELYDIEADPEELDNLYPTQRTIGDSLFAELLSGINEADRRYLGK